MYDYIHYAVAGWETKDERQYYACRINSTVGSCDVTYLPFTANAQSAAHIHTADSSGLCQVWVGRPKKTLFT